MSRFPSFLLILLLSSPLLAAGHPLEPQQYLPGYGGTVSLATNGETFFAAFGDDQATTAVIFDEHAVALARTSLPADPRLVVHAFAADGAYGVITFDEVLRRVSNSGEVTFSAALGDAGANGPDAVTNGGYTLLLRRDTRTFSIVDHFGHVLAANVLLQTSTPAGIGAFGTGFAVFGLGSAGITIERISQDGVAAPLQLFEPFSAIGPLHGPVSCFPAANGLNLVVLDTQWAVTADANGNAGTLHPLPTVAGPSPTTAVMPWAGGFVITAAGNYQGTLALHTDANGVALDDGWTRLSDDPAVAPPVVNDHGVLAVVTGAITGLLTPRIRTYDARPFTAAAAAALVSAPAASSLVGIASDGIGFAAAWIDYGSAADSVVRFVRVDRDGAPIEAARTLGKRSAFGDPVQILSNGSEYFVIGPTAFVRVSSSGVQLDATPVPLPPPPFNSYRWDAATNGDEVLVVRSGEGMTALVITAGGSVSGPFTLTPAKWFQDQNTPLQNPQAAWNGREFVVSIDAAPICTHFFCPTFTPERAVMRVAADGSVIAAPVAAPGLNAQMATTQQLVARPDGDALGLAIENGSVVATLFSGAGKVALTPPGLTVSWFDAAPLGDSTIVAMTTGSALTTLLVGPDLSVVERRTIPLTDVGTVTIATNLAGDVVMAVTEGHQGFTRPVAYALQELALVPPPVRSRAVRH